MRNGRITLRLVTVVALLLLGGSVAAQGPVRELQSVSQGMVLASGTAWKQVNESGFGYPNNNHVTALEVFRGQLYASASNAENGAGIWRTKRPVTWRRVVSSGFGNPTNAVIFDMIEFHGELYAGTGSWSHDGAPGQIWRSCNGVDWALVEGGGFGNANNTGIVNFGIFRNTLYAGTVNNADGLEIWRSRTGNSGDWSRVVVNGKDDAGNTITDGFIDFHGFFYVAVETPADGHGGEIWRTKDGRTWTSVMTGGFGDTDNSGMGGFAVFGGYLYVGTGNATTGTQIYRSHNGTTWTQVVGNGFGDTNNWKAESLIAFNGRLYAGTKNLTTGIEVWSSCDGTTWEQANDNGFGDEGNSGTLWSVGTVAYNGNLYIGTENADGGEVWSLLHDQRCSVRRSPRD